jgi:hypothetical protein
MTLNIPSRDTAQARAPFLLGVFLITFAVLAFQVVQTRILSVIAWYYLAFFAISVAMLGMTAGAVWVHLKRNRIVAGTFFTLLSDMALVAAVSMPASLLVQFSLITKLSPTITSVIAWVLLMGAMTVPYVFAGVVVSVALTRSPFSVPLVYGVDLLGAAAGCVAVVGILNVLDGPSAILFAGSLCGAAAVAFRRAAAGPERAALAARPVWRRPSFTVAAIVALIAANMAVPTGFRPILVKDQFEHSWSSRTERWNSYSRIIAYRPYNAVPAMWGASPNRDKNILVPQANLNIDGAAGTVMHHFDGTRTSIDFLRYDLVNLAYYLPGIMKSAVVGVGGGRDLLSAHLFGVQDITGVELNRIFIDLHTRHPFYARYSNLTTVPGVRLHVDDARTWFASTQEAFDLIQMSMIDTWAATGAGAFSLSENGLYTLEGWRAFTGRLTGRGVFTVSRWYNPGDVNESGRMIALGLATLMDAGVADPRRHVFVASARQIATLILSKAPFAQQDLALLRQQTEQLGFNVLVDPDRQPESPVLRRMISAASRRELDAAATTELLDLTVPTDNRPFFFNQLRFRDIPMAVRLLMRGELRAGVIQGNLVASIALALILGIAALAVVFVILLPLRTATNLVPPQLVAAGTSYFALIGLGFMFAEISLLQYFSVFLGHPIYAMGVCLFSLILSSGVGSLTSDRLRITSMARFAVWAILIGVYLTLLQSTLTHLFEVTTGQPLPVRIAICLVVVMPAGFLMGFAFPTGMTLVEAVDESPTPWFWGINGATGVLASVLAVVVGMAYGINVTLQLAGICYILLIPAARVLIMLSYRTDGHVLSSSANASLSPQAQA